MLTTLIYIALCLLLFFLSIALWAVFLRLGLRWAKAPEISTRRLVAAAIVVQLGTMSLALIFLSLPTYSDFHDVGVGLLQIAAGVLFACFVIMGFFKLRFLKSLQAWLPTLVASVSLALAYELVVKRYVTEAYVLPTNAMAPSLLGHHVRADCRKCDQDAYGSANARELICSNFHVTRAMSEQQLFFAGDRIQVAKFLTPQRWDVVVFLAPEAPTQLSAKRLVGLPGETIQIKNGAVWVNGEELVPPDSLRGIAYTTEFPHGNLKVWGSPEHPVTLGDDEYFVLGDFSQQSLDSRLWQSGAPGHNPYAVPKSHLRGVVTHIFWPVQRWRILR